MRPRCAIVDAYSAARFLPREFQALGYDCIHVQSTPEILPVFRTSFQPDDFMANVIHRGDLGATIRELAALAPELVIAGIECGVELADQLSVRIGRVTNGLDRSEARRNKYLMAETLREKGIRAVKQARVGDLASLVGWTEEHGDWPVVVKPINSAGSDGVSICHSTADVIRAYHAIAGMTNIMGKPNHDVLVQEFLKGDEYIINSVSCAGEVYFTDLWKSWKIAIDGGRKMIYDTEQLLPFDGVVQESLRGYVAQVLQALEIWHGPAHTEVMLTSQGPVLIEVGARVSGGMHPQAHLQAVGHTQFQLTALAYANHEAFFKKARVPYQVRCPIVCVALISSQEGVVAEIPIAEELKRLPSYIAAQLRVKPNGPIRKTGDLNSSPGDVFLGHPDPEILRADYLHLREREKTGFLVQ
ncbi:ATP-grasp domain-containing protein [Azospirillum canadense]|uniref:ATP-grasp domain-containing protein n=1 Tax=Azospirillum canadense TaxID=403962 RepID=UPI002227F526|nr:ATP-grasp domain-containing protein [Azospirillum canadense]MCW2239654.1 biotin carboxylase [Azospirillum canadense]